MGAKLCTVIAPRVHPGVHRPEALVATGPSPFRSPDAAAGTRRS